MSTHEVKVIRVQEINPHPNADRLEIIPIWGYSACVRKGDFKVGDLAAYIEPDYNVPVAAPATPQPEFAFLAKDEKNGFVRIKASRLRGVISYGLLIPARPSWKEGDNVMDELCIQRWQPAERGWGIGADSKDEAGPAIYSVQYDMENYQKFPTVFKDGEPVIATEKINGSNARYVFTNGRLYVGSHTRWKKESDKNGWWVAAKKYKLEEKLKKYPDHVFYAELYGFVGGYRYGNKEGYLLAFYDILHKTNWLNAMDVDKVLRDVDLPMVPVVATCPWNPSFFINQAMG